MQVPGNYNSRDTGGEMLSTSCAHFYGPFFDPKWLEPNFALQLCTFITNEDTWNNKCQASKRGSPVGKAVLVLCPGSRRNHCPTSQKLEPALLVGSDRDATEGLLTVGENRECFLPKASNGIFWKLSLASEATQRSSKGLGDLLAKTEQQ